MKRTAYPQPIVAREDRGYGWVFLDAEVLPSKPGETHCGFGQSYPLSEWDRAKRIRALIRIGIHEIRTFIEARGLSVRHLHIQY